MCGFRGIWNEKESTRQKVISGHWEPEETRNNRQHQSDRNGGRMDESFADLPAMTHRSIRMIPEQLLIRTARQSVQRKITCTASHTQAEHQCDGCRRGLQLQSPSFHQN